LLAERPLAYTTVLTLMDRLARKGIVEREKRGRAFLYHPLVEEDQVRQQALARLVGDFFQGSPERLRQYLGRGGTRAAPPAETRPGRSGWPANRWRVGHPRRSATRRSCNGVNDDRALE
jgi:hypothetical protein